MMTKTDAFRAGQLIQWGLDPKARPAQEPEYQGLINRFLDRDDFREMVRETAAGLGLLILDAGEHGLVLAPAEGSIFALRPGRFRPNPSNADMRLMDGLIQLAVAATIFPRDRDLDDDPAIARQPVTVDEVEQTLRILCDRMEEESREQPDPEADESLDGLYEAWRVYRKYLPTIETKDDRRAQRTTRRMIEYGLDRLREFGCFIKEIGAEPERFQPTYRYQVLVRELAATTAYKAVRRLMKEDA